jgi:purine-nucleoside phosphorylase
MYGYSGRYQGRRVSVMGTGMEFLVFQFMLMN